MTDDNDGTCGEVLLLVVALPALLFMQGWAFSCMWTWFVTQPFSFGPAIGIAHGCGLSLLRSLLTAKYSKSTTDDQIPKNTALAAGAVAILLFVAWIVHLQM